MGSRDYLPYRSARQYQDRKMAKWMGFFLSEHTSALQQPMLEASDEIHAQAPSDKLLLIQQLYATNLTAQFQIRDQSNLSHLIGKVTDIQNHTIGIASSKDYRFVAFEDILTITLVETIDT